MTSDRFRPTRAGIINLWDYRDEEFVFADGRLVLRGPNGSGKTKALEVLFPFVLDGRIEPRRLNPFAGEERTMKSNLLYRGQDSAHAYVWMEFRRGDDEAVTIGVGLRAQRQSDRVTRWYFVADGQVGRDFSLIGPDDRPLTKRQLAAQLGADAMTDRPADYRAMVDARLFGLGSERYEQLLTLVLTLRRPQLAKNLDPKGLSQALSDGLRPVDEELVTEAARSFGDMESVQRTLSGLVQADTAASAFLVGYTTYLRTHAKAAVDVLGARLSALESTRTGMAGTLAQRNLAQARRSEAGAAVLAREQDAGKLAARLDSLKASAAYEKKEQLDKLAELIEELARNAEDARGRVENAHDQVARRQSQLEDARGELWNAAAAVSRAARDLAEAAADAGIPWGAGDVDHDATATTSRVVARVEARTEDVTVVRRGLVALDAARAERDRAQRARDRAERAAQDASEAMRRAAEELAAARASAADALGSWWDRHRAVCEEFDMLLLKPLHAALAGVGEPDAPTVPARFDELVADGVQTRRDELARLAHALERERDALAELRAEREQIASERDDAPPGFAARTGSRQGRAGAPLWQLVRFADGVSEDDAAAIEAALHAANLLDAWLDPADGDGPGDSETVLVPLPDALRPSGSTLADVLVPEPSTPVAETRIGGVLRSIAYGGDGASAAAPTITDTGRFVQGIQIGAHTKPHAEYIGATARARRRAARLAELDGRIGQSQLAITQYDERVTDGLALLRAIAAARTDLPGTAAITDALRAEVLAAGVLRATNDALAPARIELDQAVAEVGARERALHKLATEHAIATTATDIDAIADAVARFRANGMALASARETEHTRSEQVAAAEREVDDALAAYDGHVVIANQAESKHRGHQEELATLRAAVGASADRVDADIAATRAAIETADADLQEARRQEAAAINADGRAEGECGGARNALHAAVVEAQTDAQRLGPYASRELLDLLRVQAADRQLWPGVATDWPDTSSLAEQAVDVLAEDPDAQVAALPASVSELYEALLAATADLRPTEASLKSSRTRVSGALAELQTQLASAGHDYRPDWDSVDDVIVVRVADEQGFASIGDFARRIAEARRDQEQLLTESERRILEDAVLGRLASQIHERTTDARDLIGQMNREMRGRRMSSGSAIGVTWELADTLDEHQRDVCKLMDRDASRLDSEQLARMRAHFAGQIKIARAARPDRSYAEILSEALDYRRWRTFGFTLIGADGSEDRLTTARHSKLSGGEQSVSLHLPLFAAAHVMLSSADAHCPRLLALDEAFAGVDDNGRNELLGLTAEFDLDLFMTGHDLWATYASVPACAHYDLAHSSVEHTVSALLLVWDGALHVDRSGAGDLAAALGSPGSRRTAVESDAEGLLT